MKIGIDKSIISGIISAKTIRGKTMKKQILELCQRMFPKFIKDKSDIREGGRRVLKHALDQLYHADLTAAERSEIEGDFQLLTCGLQLYNKELQIDIDLTDAFVYNTCAIKLDTEIDKLADGMPHLYEYGCVHLPETCVFKYLIFMKMSKGADMGLMLVEDYDRRAEEMAGVYHIVGIGADYFYMSFDLADVEKILEKEASDQHREEGRLLATIFINMMYYISEKTPKTYTYFKKKMKPLETVAVQQPDCSFNLKPRSYIDVPGAPGGDVNIYDYGGEPQSARVKHWVRGFWRNQSYGPRHSLRKRILVKPHIRGSQDGGDREQIYVVKTPHPTV